MAESKKDILKMAMIFTQEGRWDKAISEYKKLLTLDPTDYNIHNMLGDVFAKKEDDTLAYESYITSAEAYAKQGLADKASVIYKKIGKLNIDKLSETDRQKAMLIKRNSVAEKFIEDGQVDKAIGEYKEILKINPANFDTYQKLGELFSQTGDQKEALNYYRKIVDVYFKNRLYKKALPIYQKILELQPDSIVTREKIAEIYEREENESEAKREYLNLAEYYWSQHDIEKTDYFAQKAIDFKSIEAHYFKGVTLLEKKDYAEAKKELEMLLKFKANHTAALFSLAEINMETGQVDEAIKTLEKAAKADPDNTDGFLLLGEVLTKKGMKKEASLKYLMAINTFARKNEKEKAEMLALKVLEQDPDNIDLLLKIAELASQTGKKKDAADAYIKISDIYNKEGNTEKAQENYKLAQEMDPAHPKIVAAAKNLGAAQVKKYEAKPDRMPTFAADEDVIEQPPQKNEPAKQDIFSRPAPKIQMGYFNDAFEQAPAAKGSNPFLRPEPVSQPEHIIELSELGDMLVDKPVKADTIKQDVIPKKDAVPEARQQEFGQQTREDVPSLIAMADSLVLSGSFDEAIEMYQKGLSLDPGNASIKDKLNRAYSRYAGVPLPDPAEKRKAEEAAARKAQEEERRKNEEEDKRKRLETAKLKAEQENKKKEEQAKEAQLNEARTKEAADRELQAKEAQRKKEEEQAGKRQNEEKRKREEELSKKRAEEKKKAPAPEPEEIIEEPEISDDFATVTTAEIFMKQGLLTEAEKILKRILTKDTENMEAKIRLDELKKLMADMQQEETKPEKEPDKGPKGSKVSYI
jgi:tetratricopeptide (TPR) repeat protein